MIRASLLRRRLDTTLRDNVGLVLLTCTEVGTYWVIYWCLKLSLARWGSRLYSLWDGVNPTQGLTIQPITFLERYNECLEWSSLTLDEWCRSHSDAIVWPKTTVTLEIGEIKITLEALGTATIFTRHPCDERSSELAELWETPKFKSCVSLNCRTKVLS